ncbi:MAG: TFIIB-type zinc ribbon-containing protein [Halobacteriaceae archaeon]
MRVRGERECKDCGERWSYFDTGRVTCPACGSAHSVGRSDRALHTASAADLDLADARDRVSESLREAGREAAASARAYVARAGFVDGGDLRPLEDRFLVASELRYAGSEVARATRPDEAVEGHFLALLSAASDGQRPGPDEVPDALRGARGLGCADAAGQYATEVVEWLDWREAHAVAVRDLFDRLRPHRRRVEALDGEVDPRTAERLVAVAREAGRAARVTAGADEGGNEAASAEADADAEAAISTARERLDALDEASEPG